MKKNIRRIITALLISISLAPSIQANQTIPKLPTAVYLSQGKLLKVRKSMTSKPRPSQHDKNMALTMSVEQGYTKIVAYLLAYGAQPTSTQLASAISRKHPVIARSLLAGGAKPKTPEDAQRFLLIAIEKNYNRLIKPLLTKGAHPNRPGQAANTPLHVATKLDNKSAVKTILSQGGSPGEKNNDGDTPLHIAVRKNYTDIASALAKKMTTQQLNTPNNPGNRPLDEAVKAGNSKMVQLLLKKGAIVDEKTISLAKKDAIKKLLEKKKK